MEATALEKKAIDKVAKEVSRRFPELAGTRARVEPAKEDRKGQANFLLTFHGRVLLPGGKSMPRVVRVIADASGKILKLTTSK